jgi:hypothetical protein
MCETYSTSKQTHLQHVWKKQIKYWEQKLATYVYNHCNIYNILIHFCNIRMKTCNIRLKHLKHLKHTLATYAFRTTSSYCSREYKLLLTARENRSLSAYGVHQRKRPGTRSGEDGAHIEFKEVTDGSQKNGLPVVLGSHPEFKEPVVLSVRVQAWTTRQEDQFFFL